MGDSLLCSLRQRLKVRLLASILFMVIATPVSLTAQDASPPPEVDAWKIPSLVFLSGPWAALGLEAKWALDIAVEELNAAGGIRGIPVKLAWYDTAYDPAKTVQQMARVLDRKPLIILGPQSDVPQSAGLPLAARTGVFCLAGAGNPKPFKKVYPWATCLLDTMFRLNQPAAKYWIERHSADITAVVIFTQMASTSMEEQADGIRDVLTKKGVKVIPYIEAPPETVDFRSLVLKALNKRANGFVGIVPPDQAAKIVIQLRRNGVKEGWRIWNYLAANGPPLYEIGEGFLEDTYINEIYNPNHEGERWQRLLMKYREWREDPNAVPSYFVAYSYDLPWMVKQAFEAIGVSGNPNKRKAERKKIRDHILNLKDFEGVQGKITVRPRTGGASNPSFFFQIRNNKPILITRLRPMTDSPGRANP